MHQGTHGSDIRSPGAVPRLWSLVDFFVGPLSHGREAMVRHPLSEHAALSDHMLADIGLAGGRLG
jgi:hypothetical protein